MPTQWRVLVGHGQFGHNPDQPADKSENWYVRTVHLAEARQLPPDWRCNSLTEPAPVWAQFKRELQIDAATWDAMFNPLGFTVLQPFFLSRVQAGVRQLEFRLGQHKHTSDDMFLQMGHWFEYMLAWALLECRNPMLIRL